MPYKRQCCHGSRYTYIIISKFDSPVYVIFVRERLSNFLLGTDYTDPTD